MKNLYVKYNDEFIYVGYIEPFVYEGETLYKVERKGMFTEVFKRNELKQFLNEHRFIVRSI